MLSRQIDSGLKSSAVVTVGTERHLAHVAHYRDPATSREPDWLDNPKVIELARHVLRILDFLRPEPMKQTTDRQRIVQGPETVQGGSLR